MKRSTVSSILFAFMFVFTLSISAQAQDSKSSDNVKIIKKDAKKEKRVTKILSLKEKRAKLKGKSYVVPFDRSGPTVSPKFNRELKWIKKFKLLISKYMNLPPELQLQTERIIDVHRLDSLRKFYNLQIPVMNNANRRRLDKTADSTVKDPKNEEYLGGFQTYRERMLSGKEGRPELIMYHAAELLDNLLALMPDEHNKQFDELIIRWDITYSGGMPDGPLRRLNRIIKSPLLDFTNEVRFDILGIIGSNMRRLGTIRNRTEAKKRKAYEKTREEIFKKLTPAQQAEVDKSMKLIDEYIKIMGVD